MNIGLQKGHAKERRTAGRCSRRAACIALGSLGMASVQDASAQGIPCRYEVAHVIQAPPCGDIAQPTTALAISPGGRWVVGYHCACVCIEDRAFVFDTTTGVFTTLPLPAGMFTSTAYDVNDAGKVVGHIGGNPGDFGFVYDIASGQYTLLPPGIAQDGTCSANGINADGIVCGTRTIGGPPGYPKSAFIWSDKQGFTDLGLINGFSTFGMDIAEDGTVAGEMGSVNGVAVPCTWDGVNLLEGPTLAGFSTRPLAINDSGIVAGWAAITPGFSPQVRGFVWTESGMTSIGVLHGFDRSYALDVSDSGIVVGVCELIGSSMQAPIIWREGTPIDLRTKVVSSSIALRSASAISDAGVVCAEASSGGSVISVVLTPLHVTGDVDGNCLIDIEDLLAVISAWGPHEKVPSPADVNHDGFVDLLDLLIVIDEWTP